MDVAAGADMTSIRTHSATVKLHIDKACAVHELVVDDKPQQTSLRWCTIRTRDTDRTMGQPRCYFSNKTPGVGVRKPSRHKNLDEKGPSRVILSVQGADVAVVNAAVCDEAGR